MELLWLVEGGARTRESRRRQESGRRSGKMGEREKEATRG